MGTNLLFNVGGWSFSSQKKKLAEVNKVVVQGKIFNQDIKTKINNFQEVIDYCSKVIWITYRRNFPQLIKELHLQSSNTNYISDTGWGCMVRAGQMSFAECLRRHISQTTNIDLNSKLNLKNIIEGFLDEDNYLADFAPYSIQKISKIAYSQFKLLPGEWYNPIRICYILGLLHNEKSCLRGTDNLKVAVFTSAQPIIFEDFLERMCKVDESRNKHNHLCGTECRIIKNQPPKPKIEEEDVFVVYGGDEPQFPLTFDIRKKLVCPIHHELQFSLLAYIVCMIGKDSPQENFLNLSLKLMDFKYSLGILGGKPKRALYFIGRTGDDLIYLDPHFVQESSNSHNITTPQQISTYFCNKFQTLPSKMIDTSFSFIFYLKDLVQLEEFYQFIMKLKKEYNDALFTFFTDSDPYLAMGEEHFSSNILSTKNLQPKSEVKSQKPQKEKSNGSQKYDGAGDDDGNDSDEFEVI